MRSAPQLLEAIRKRRSVRRFSPRAVEVEIIEQVIEAARWAPSGKNNQPWRFVVVKEEGMRRKLAELTIYGDIIKQAPCCVVVFMDKEASYDRTKDLQAIGAAIQNMLLAAHSLGLGSCWIGEILKNRERVEELLAAPPSCELMAVVALGYSVEQPLPPRRKKLAELILREF